MLQTPINSQTLYALAPSRLPSYRNDRFTGDTISVDFNEFAPIDQVYIRQLYDMLLALHTIFEQHDGNYDQLVQATYAYAQSINLVTFVHAMQQLGYATAATQSTPTLNRVIHDIKGGGFAATVMTLQMLPLDIDIRENITRLAFLVRDHMAIMRNCVRHLDEQTEQFDQYHYSRHIAIIEQTWDQALYSLPQGSARVILDSRFAGAVSASETEFAALRRTLYNLINNAVRYTTDGYVYLSIFGVAAQQEDVRFVVYNKITPDHLHQLQQRYEHEFSGLFRGGFSTGGSGLGMRICGEFIAEDYGIDVDQCIKQKYIGATLSNGYFVVWFHWPAVTQRQLGLT